MRGRVIDELTDAQIVICLSKMRETDGYTHKKQTKDAEYRACDIMSLNTGQW
jgi:hypothetical protein